MLEDMFVRYDLAAPYARDHGDEFRKANRFTMEDGILVFLLNESNKVELVGTPLFQPRLSKLYQERIINRFNQ
jgi:hypothetical protein